MVIDKKLVKNSRIGLKGTVEYNVLRCNPDKAANKNGEKQKVLYLIPGATGESEGGTM